MSAGNKLSEYMQTPQECQYIYRERGHVVLTRDFNAHIAYNSLEVKVKKGNKIITQIQRQIHYVLMDRNIDL